MIASHLSASHLSYSAHRLRWQSFDVLRGLAVLLMVAFHIVFDLRYFLGIAELSYASGVWYYVGKLSAILFIGVTGAVAMIRFRERGSVVWALVIRRAALLGAGALMITIVTAMFVPHGIVHFGILHFLAVSAMLVPLILRVPWYGLAALGSVLILLAPSIRHMTVATSALLPFGLPPPAYFTFDYYPLMPWFGITLLGMAVGALVYTYRMQLPQLSMLANLRPLTWAGRHSLAIYLLHQPIILFVLQLIFPERNPLGL